MSGPPAKQRARRGSAPDLLRVAARDLFAYQGYSRTTTREIAERAGVSHELVFRYFGTKEALLYEAVLNPMLESIKQGHLAWKQEPPQARTRESIVARDTAALYTFLVANRSSCRALVHLFTEGATDEEVLRLRGGIAEALEPMITSFAEARPAGRARDLDPDLRLRLLMVLFGAAAVLLPYTYANDALCPDDQAVIAELTRFILDGLG
jgi:AcrR family transcriptional regulator